jgi:hypothetical protein
MIKKGIVLFSFIFGIFLLNLFLMPIEEFIPPSQKILNDVFAYKYWYYEHKPQQDYLIMGNSRTHKGVNPDVFAQQMSKQSNNQVSAHSLSTGGGYFPFYHEVLTFLIKDHLPKNLILGVSPRDFNVLENRNNKVKNILQRSSGYQLKRIPYKDPFNSLEKYLTNLHSVILPALYYKTHLESLIFNTQSYDLTDSQSKLGWLANRWFRQLQTMVPIHLKIPQADLSLSKRLKVYFDRFVYAFDWEPTKKHLANENGALMWFYEKETEAQLLLKTMELQKEWEALRAEHGDRYRTSDYCKTHLQLDNRNTTLHMDLFRFLERKGVQVYLVLIPALYLEGCENNYAFNEQLITYLNTLKEQFPNIQEVIDLNQNFNHQFMDISHYEDVGEHLNQKSSTKVSEMIADRVFYHTKK